MQDVFALGDINVDVVTQGFSFSREKQQPVGIFMTKGGEAFNFACASSRLGLKTRFLGMVGRDFLGRFLREKAREFGLNRPLEREGKTGITVALTQDDRRFLTFRGENANLSRSDLPKIGRSRIFYVGGIWHLESLQKDLPDMFREARQSSTTCLNIGCDYEGKRVILEKVLPHVDIFFLNDDELAQIGKKPEEIIKMGVKMVVVHRGHEGSDLYDREGKFHAAAMAKSKQVLNPTGSGDIFNAAFIFSLLKGKPFDHCLKFGNAAGALHAISEGDFVPSYGDIIKFGGFKK